MTASSWNRRLKRGPGWIVLLFAFVALVVIGSARSTGPQTPEDRVDGITQRIACPICDGESVFESQNNASRAIRNEVTVLVRDNDLNDDEIVAFVENRYGADVLLVPKASGFDALVWVLPAVGFVVGVAALAVAFRRWKLAADETSEATDADRALVEAALRDEPDDE